MSVDVGNLVGWVFLAQGLFLMACNIAADRPAVAKHLFPIGTVHCIIATRLVQSLDISALWWLFVVIDPGWVILVRLVRAAKLRA